jgi:hypothetical protein
MKGEHYLLPHERWFANRGGLSPQNPPKTRAAMRIVQNYGPEGPRFIAASVADQVPGGFVGFVGGLLRGLSPGGVGWVVTSSCLIGIGLAAVMLGLARVFQLVRIGRAFRDGRPYTRLPSGVRR